MKDPVFKNKAEPGGGGHAFSPSTEGGRDRWFSVSSNPAWSMELVLGESRPPRETLSPKQKCKTKVEIERGRNPSSTPDPTHVCSHTVLSLAA